MDQAKIEEILALLKQLDERLRRVEKAIEADKAAHLRLVGV